MLPGSALNRVGVSVSLLSRNGRRNSGVGVLHCLPVSEVPGLQFFDNDAIYNGELAASRLTTGRKTGVQSNLFQLCL